MKEKNVSEVIKLLCKDKQQCVEHPNIEELKITNNFSKMKIDDDAQCSEEPLYEFNVNEFKPYMFITHLQALKHDRSYIGHEKLLRLLTPNGLATGTFNERIKNLFFATVKILLFSFRLQTGQRNIQRNYKMPE